MTKFIATCLFCTDNSCAACKPTRPHWHEWFTIGKATPKKHIENVRVGLHPLGMRLLENNDGSKTCRNCAHRYVVQLAARYQNCSQVKHTGGAATDVKLKWWACDKWEAKNAT